MAKKQRNYIVKYSNEMNKVELGKLSIREAKLMAAVCAYIKNQGVRKVTMDFSLIRELSGYTDRNNERLYVQLQTMSRKLLAMSYEHRDGRKSRGFNLFAGWELDADKQRFSLNVTEEFEFVLNKLGGNFTRFETNEFKAIDGKYAISLYRLLKQFRKTGVYCVHIEDFRELLNVPPSYKISNIDKSVIKPAIEELSQYFESLTVRKIYKKGIGRGGQVVKSLEFTFTPEEELDEKNSQSIADDLRRLIAETELKILSTQKAMNKQSDLGNWKQYEVHKKKNIYFKEKLETLNRNFKRFEPEQLSLEIPEIDSPTEDEKATAQENVNALINRMKYSSE